METRFRTLYTPRKRTPMLFQDEHGEPLPSMTEQCHKDTCDIHKIIKQYDKHGLITHVNKAAAQYGDFSEINEYKENLNMVNAAQSSFDELPSLIRQRFNNDPGLFFEFVTNPANNAEMVKLGLAEKVAEEIVQKVELVNTPLPLEGFVDPLTAAALEKKAVKS